MAKSSGLTDNFYVAGYDLSGDIGSLEKISGGPQLHEVTGINASAKERVTGLRDGAIDFSAWFNKASNQAHPRLSTLPTGNVIVTYFRGTTLGGAGAGMVAKQLNYDPKRASDGALSFDVSAVASAYGLNWGIQGTAGKRSDTTATAGTAIDNGAASAFGLQAFLQVFSFTGTSCTVAIQESSDNGADAYVNVVGGVFTAASGVTSERVATASGLAVERYLKVTTSGTFSQCTFAVLICRNATSTVF